MARPIIKNKQKESPNLTLAGQTLGIEGGNFVTLPTSGGSGTNNSFNTMFTDAGGTTLGGAIDGVNRVFTVSEGQYKAGSLQVNFRGQMYPSLSQAITETDPATGVFTVNFLPLEVQVTDEFFVTYQVGTINSLDTGQPDQTISIVSDELRLTRNGQADSVADLTPYLGGGGGGVQTITGDLVDNTDPLNPSVNADSLINGTTEESVIFNGVDAFGKLPELYSLTAVGDYIEFTAKFLNAAGTYQENMGIFGTVASNQNHSIGFLSNTNFSIRASDNTWVGWATPSRTDFNKFRIEVTSVGNLTLTVNDLVISEQPVTLPLDIEDIANNYTGEFTNVEIKAVEIHTATQDLSVTDLTQDPSITLSNTTTNTSVLTEPIGAEILLDISHSIDDIRIRIPSKSKDSYVEYNFVHQPDVSRNSDVWRNTTMYKLDNDKTRILTLTNSGEFETAIKQAGKPDFMGGVAHGDEELVNFKLLVDGIERNVTEIGNYKCRILEFFQYSELFEEGTSKGTKVADYYKHWKWDIATKKMTIKHHIGWIVSIDLVDSYMAMLPILRVDGTTEITSKGIRSPFYQEEDIIASGHSQTFTDANHVKVWSDTISAEMKVVEGWDSPNREFFISGAPQYNKLYFDFTGSGYTTQIGETFDAIIEYKIEIK